MIVEGTGGVAPMNSNWRSTVSGVMTRDGLDCSAGRQCNSSLHVPGAFGTPIRSGLLPQGTRCSMSESVPQSPATVAEACDHRQTPTVAPASVEALAGVLFLPAIGTTQESEVTR